MRFLFANLREEQFVKQSDFHCKWIESRGSFSNPVKNSLHDKEHKALWFGNQKEDSCINDSQCQQDKNLWLCLLRRIILCPDLNHSLLIITKDHFCALYRECIPACMKKILNFNGISEQVNKKNTTSIILQVPE